MQGARLRLPLVVGGDLGLRVRSVLSQLQDAFDKDRAITLQLLLGWSL
ncbi:MAG: hypothetical protein WCE62_15110 [Polyangiales bacterium]